MRKCFWSVAAVSFILLGIIGTAHAGSYDGPGFSGTAWVAENGGEIRQMGDVHVGAGGFRMNMVTQGQHMSSLIKWNSDSVWSLMHDQKMYMEIPREQTGLEAFDPKPCSGFEQGEKVGSETVSGRKTEKWRCTGQKMVPPGQQPSDATTWYDPALKFEIKTVDDSGNVFEIRDIAVGAQDASMFQIPSGYRELDMNGLMQQMMKQQGQQ